MAPLKGTYSLWVTTALTTAALFTAPLSKASVADVCAHWFRYLGNHELTTSAGDQIKIEEKNDLLSSQVRIVGPKFEIRGRRLSNSYKFPNLNVDDQSLMTLALIETQDGLRYLLINRAFHKNAYKNRDYLNLAALTPDELKLRVREYPDYSRLLLWRETLRNPEWLSNYGIFADKDILVFPVPTSMNKIFDKLEGTPWALGQRYEEMSSLRSSGQKYSPDSFFNAFLKGLVKIAVKGNYGQHDLVDTHMIGSFLIPPALFKRMVNEARFIQSLEDDPEIGEKFRPQIRFAKDGFSSYWDLATNTLSHTASVFDYNGASKIDRRTFVYKILAGRAYTDQEIVPLPSDYLDDLNERLTLPVLRTYIAFWANPNFKWGEPMRQRVEILKKKYNLTEIPLSEIQSYPQLKYGLKIP